MNRAAGARDGTVVLEGGRRLGYRLRGNLDGPVIVYLHGSPGSRVEGGFFTDEELRAAGVSMLALERPGYGLSDPVSDVDLPARASEVIQACDLLGVGSFVVGGTSGGGTYTLAVAAAASDRVAAAVTIAGQARLDTPWAMDGMPPERAAEFASTDVEADRRDCDEEVATLAVPADEALTVWESWFEGFPDDEIAFVRAAGDVFVEDGHEASRQGGHGYWIDGMTRAMPWPFTASELTMPVHVFLSLIHI